MGCKDLQFTIIRKSVSIIEICIFVYLFIQDNEEVEYNHIDDMITKCLCRYS